MEPLEKFPTLVWAKNTLSNNVQVLLDSDDVLVRFCNSKAAEEVMWQHTKTNHLQALILHYGTDKDTKNDPKCLKCTRKSSSQDAHGNTIWLGFSSSFDSGKFLTLFNRFWASRGLLEAAAGSGSKFRSERTPRRARGSMLDPWAQISNVLTKPKRCFFAGLGPRGLSHAGRKAGPDKFVGTFSGRVFKISKHRITGAPLGADERVA